MPPPPARLLGVPSRENHVLAPSASPPVKVIVMESTPATVVTAPKLMLGPSYPEVPPNPVQVMNVQAPSPSKPKASADDDALSVMELIVAPLLLVKPTSVSSTPSYGLPLPRFVTEKAEATPPLWAVTLICTPQFPPVELPTVGQIVVAFAVPAVSRQSPQPSTANINFLTIVFMCENTPLCLAWIAFQVPLREIVQLHEQE